MATTKIASGAGLRSIKALLIDSEGYPTGGLAVGTMYGGFKIENAKSFTSTVPDSQLITHTGNDQPFAQDVLPPTSLENATLTAASTNLYADALLSSTKTQDVSATVAMGVMSTGKQGCEPQVVVYGWRQALGADPDDAASYGRRRFITNLYPSARVVPQGGNAEEGSDDVNNYAVVPTSVLQTPWGVALSVATNGSTRAQRLRFISETPVAVEGGSTDGTVTEFTVTQTPVSVAKTKVWYYGTPQTVTAVNTTTKTFTLQSAPAAATDRLVVLYETADSCGV